MVLRSFDAMAASTIQHPEGTLIYVTDKKELFMREEDGVRKVLVIV